MQRALPVMTAYRFNQLCDHIFSPNSKVELSQIKKGDMLYLSLGSVVDFVENILPYLEEDIMLYSGIVYDPKSKQMPNHNATIAAHHKLLEHPRVRAWFGGNLPYDHFKIQPLPLGFSWRIKSKYDLLANTQKQLSIESFFSKKNLHTYSNFGSTHFRRKQLAKIYKQKGRYPFITRSSNKPFEQYLKDLRISRFVISPRGVNPDCFRTWEALYCGAIPIVERTGIEKVYQDLPVIIVDNLEDISRKFLDAKLEEMKHKTYKLEKLDFNYWVKKIRDMQNRIREGKELFLP